MLDILLKLPAYMSGRRWGWPRMLPLNLTLTPSPRCNSRCQTCNIWKKRVDELTVGEWERVLRGVGRAPAWVTLSGGEPFLYPHLAELAGLVHAYCRPSILNIPTNGLLADRIPETVQQIVLHCPGTQIVVNLSLDGVGERHDVLRGVSGNFARFEAAYAALKDLARTLPNLTVGIHSVISAYNAGEMLPLYDYVFARNPDSYITEIAEERVELDTMGLGLTPGLTQYADAIDPLIKRMRHHRFGRIGRLTEAFRFEYYKLVKRILAERTQVIACYAGWTSGHIFADGSVWACCVRAEPVGNLRVADYDFKRVWFSPTADRVRQSITRKECACPLANAAYTNMLLNPPTLARVAWRLTCSALAWSRALA